MSNKAQCQGNLLFQIHFLLKRSMVWKDCMIYDLNMASYYNMSGPITVQDVNATTDGPLSCEGWVSWKQSSCRKHVAFQVARHHQHLAKSACV